MLGGGGSSATLIPCTSWRDRELEANNKVKESPHCPGR